MTTDTELVEYVPPSVTVFGTDNPVSIVARSKEIAVALGTAIKDAHMTTNISGKDYVRVEGWAMLGSMLGVFPVVRSTRELRTEEGVLIGFEATVDVVTRSGDVVGGATAICTRDERNWKNRDDYALLSMAQTRATGKAYRMPFGFVMAAAGFEATPAEEMPTDAPQERAQRPAQPKRTPQADVEPPRPTEKFLADIKEMYHLDPDEVVDALGITMPRIAKLTHEEQNRAWEKLRQQAEGEDEGEHPF